MPIYEYQCLQCDDRSEELQGINDPRLTECSICGGELKKLMSAPSFQFKGSGWYVTDYGKGGAGKKGSESDSGDSVDDSSAKKVESTSDAKTKSSSEGSKKESSGSGSGAGSSSSA